MTVGTPRLHQQNVELFARLNQELKSIQGQVGSGKVDLKLSGNLHDISKLNAAEEKKSEVTQFMQNAKRASKDIEFLDVALDRLQNLTVNFQTMAVESANDMLGQKEKDLKEMDKQIQSEINSGLVMDPTQVNMFDTMDRQNAAFSPELQGIQADDSFDREQDSADANLEREMQKQKSLPPSQPKDK